MVYGNVILTNVYSLLSIQIIPGPPKSKQNIVCHTVRLLLMLPEESKWS